MNILEALAEITKKEERVVCNDGLMSVSDAVWGACLHRLGLNAEDYNDIELDERHIFLDHLDKFYEKS